MKEINVDFYGGKPIFGGRETPLKAEIVECDKYDKCSFYKEGKCFCAGRWKPDCKFGKKIVDVGYTTRAKKYYDFRNKYTKKDCYHKLEEPNDILGNVDDTFIINTGFLFKDEKTNKYYIDTKFGTSPLIYIKRSEFDNKLIKLICSAHPKTFFENQEIKDYQEKVVPRFLYELKTRYNDIYNRFIEEYPIFKTRNINFIGREVYIKSLDDNTIIKDNENNKYKKTGKYLISIDEWKSFFLPFKAKKAHLEIEINDKMTCKITDNNQVNDNTVFVD